ncbi:hypothetical protein G5V59_11045 [Nocardioides sp. W3-2-3]|uniref:chorismate-binding protein n=1 Tax=Nocardioides convexus TaxID=2712224 RepID=UPI002418B02E|nr:chorismate-binding protein [Nocardioides convexus]NHA00427.1 hypothetical protein [Nocardioides convexus]
MARQPITPAALAARPLLFASGEEAYVAAQVLDTLQTPDGANAVWAEEVVATLGPGERALCALSFAAGAPGLAHRVTGSEHPLQRPERDAEVERTYQVTEFPTADEYAAMVETALARIADGSLHKVVLGRCLDVLSDPPLVPAEIIDRLLTTRPGRYVFSVPLVPGPDEGPILVGASPEPAGASRRPGDLLHAPGRLGSPLDGPRRGRPPRGRAAAVRQGPRRARLRGGGDRARAQGGVRGDRVPRDPGAALHRHRVAPRHADLGTSRRRRRRPQRPAPGPAAPPHARGRRGPDGGGQRGHRGPRGGPARLVRGLRRLGRRQRRRRVRDHHPCRGDGRPAAAPVRRCGHRRGLRPCLGGPRDRRQGWRRWPG